MYKRQLLHRDDELPTQPLIWDSALETPELKAYNEYLHTLATGSNRKTWGNPRGLPEMLLESGPDEQSVVAS